MKTSLAIAAICLLSTSLLIAQEIKISKPYLVGSDSVERKKFDGKLNDWINVDGVGYAFVAYVTNVSDQPITVATGGFTTESSPDEESQIVILRLDRFSTNDGSLVIPTLEDLRLVELRSGESALLSVDFSSVAIKDLTIHYIPEDHYDGRFGYWTGKAESETFQMEAPE